MRSPTAWLRKVRVERYERKARKRRNPVAAPTRPYTGPHVRSIDHPKYQPSIAAIRKKKRREAGKRAKASRKRNRVHHHR